MPVWWDDVKSVSAIKRFTLGLALLAAICAVGVSISCRRSVVPKQTTPARNLTPGLSEELTAFANRHRGKLLVLIDGSSNSEEARNLADLIAKAFEAGVGKSGDPTCL